MTRERHPTPRVERHCSASQGRHQEFSAPRPGRHEPAASHVAARPAGGGRPAALSRADHGAIGDNPDLILAGQTLHLP